MLISLILTPIIGILGLILWPGKKGREQGMIISIITLYISLKILLEMNNNNIEYQFREIIDLYYYKITLGLDGISLSLIILTTLLTPILILLKERKNREDENQIVIILLTIESLLIFLFSTLDLFLFFLFFELILIPMFILIGKFGSKERKIEAAYRFIIYSLIGSLIMLLSLIIMFLKYGTTHNEILSLKLSHESLFLLKIFWLSFFISFAIKVPIFPFHTWLPFVHVEAPTIGSMLLAGILLKLGSFGILRYNVGLLQEVNGYYLPVVIVMVVISVIYGALTTIRQIDLKKIIAYSSIVHMNYAIIGFFSNDVEGLHGASYLMISHAFISCGLFLLVGLLYKRYHTRILLYFQGLAHTMPVFTSLFILFTLGNMSLPLTSAFISEILILISTYKLNILIGLILTIGLIFSTVYAIWLSNRLLFGNLSPYLKVFQDLTINEFIALLPLILFTFLFGIFSKFILALNSLTILNLL